MQGLQSALGLAAEYFKVVDALALVGATLHIFVAGPKRGVADAVDNA